VRPPIAAAGFCYDALTAAIEVVVRNRPAEEFLSNARYCLMLAEQADDPDLRDHLLQLVRAWLAAAKVAEDAR
jgi:hypothetical protein